MQGRVDRQHAETILQSGSAGAGATLGGTGAGAPAAAAR
jgi:hypothetical protein